MHTSTNPVVPSNTERDNPELVRFRQEWLSELQRRKGTAPSGGTSALPGSPPTVDSEVGDTQPFSATGASAVKGGKATLEEAISGRSLPTSHPAVDDSGLVRPSHISATLESALNIYRRAVEHEQKGELDEALLLYRQAFRMDENVDRAFHREQMLKNIFQGQKNTAPPPNKEAEDLSASIESTLTIKPGKSVPPLGSVVGILADLLQGFPKDLKFEPENENEPALLNMLPEELVTMILKRLDTTSIERFAKVNRKARVMSLDTGIWRELVNSTYKPPQIPDMDTLLPMVDRYLYDFRRLYIELPRVRLDGVYIATCHYSRPGLSENHWVNISHLVTYHRYLRFLPNGQVLSLLANDEHHPQQIIPLLKSTLRMKGLLLGSWKLAGTTIQLSNLIDASGKFALPEPGASSIIQLQEPGTPPTGNRTRYVFDMSLNLRSRPLGRWNRLDIQSYYSVHLGTGDTNPVASKNDRPFWFSKVRSYT